MRIRSWICLGRRCKFFDWSISKPVGCLFWRFEGVVISLSLFDLTFRSVNLIYLTLSGSFEATNARVEPWARSSCFADEMVPGMRTVTCFERESASYVHEGFRPVSAIWCRGRNVFVSSLVVHGLKPLVSSLGTVALFPAPSPLVCV